MEKQPPNKEDHRPGKVKALHEAGWSNAKIADEMKCSTWSVSMILKELREQEEKQSEVNTDKMSYTIIENADHAAWLKSRTLGIGGSDAAAILGLEPIQKQRSCSRRKPGNGCRRTYPTSRM